MEKLRVVLVVDSLFDLMTLLVLVHGVGFAHALEEVAGRLRGILCVLSSILCGVHLTRARSTCLGLLEAAEHLLKIVLRWLLVLLLLHHGLRLSSRGALTRRRSLCILLNLLLLISVCSRKLLVVPHLEVLFGYSSTDTELTRLHDMRWQDVNTRRVVGHVIAYGI